MLSFRLPDALMDAHEAPRIQVLAVSDFGRRRRWTDAEKVRIVKENYGPGLKMAEKGSSWSNPHPADCSGAPPAGPFA